MAERQGTIEAAKSNCSRKKGVVTRRINELSNAIRNDVNVSDLREKVKQVKEAMENLGLVFDDYVTIFDELTEKEIIETAEKWYYEYDNRANRIIAQASRVIDPVKKIEEKIQPDRNIKLEKLKLPIFESCAKDYFRWKSTFERYVNHLDSQAKYDYLSSHTRGKAHDYVMNISNYEEAIAILDEKYGNKHVILKILLDDIRKIQFVRKGDFLAFENLSFKVRNFKDRLVEMEMETEVENSYILHELESKLNGDDLQRWLESLDTTVDSRKVKDFVLWLDKQTHIRKLTHMASSSNYESQRKSPLPTVVSRGRYNASNITARIGNSPNCHMCARNHNELYECEVFSTMTPNERWDTVKDMGICFMCLRPGHRKVTCGGQKCDICNGPHHRLLHNPRWPTNEENIPLNPNATEYTSSQVKINSNSECYVYTERTVPKRSFLPIVQMNLKNDTKEYKCKALLDSGSEINVISKKCYNRLQLDGDTVKIGIVGVGGVVTNKVTKIVYVTVTDSNNIETEVECIVLDEVCGKTIPIEKTIVDQFKEYDIPWGNREEEVDIILGMTYPQFHRHKVLCKKTNGLTLIETNFGYCIVGPVPNKGNYERGLVGVNKVTVENSIRFDENICNNLEAEMAGIYKDCLCTTKDDDELLFEEMMKTAWTVNEDGRFCIKLPWKNDPSLLKNNRTQAISRDNKLVESLSKKTEVMNLFEEQIENMKENGVLRQVEEDVPRRYLPLIAVVDLTRKSTKVRICLDSKSRYRGHSLNDVLLKGKIEMNEILQVLTRFRVGKNALLGDIEKMYWQIHLHPDDQKYHGVIWKGRTYVFTRVSFGNLNSPPIADRGMIRIALQKKNTHPHATEVLIKKRYMDDLVDADDNEEKIIKTKKEIDEVLGEFGFSIKEWYSNNSRIGKISQNKVLGLNWEAECDKLSIVKKNIGESNFTKRSILSSIASVWDPLGICSAVLMKGRLIFQSVVRMKTDWDKEIINEDLKMKWEAWKNQIEKCSDITIDRNIVSIKSMKRCGLIGFSDGSSSGFGCAVYLRWTNKDESNVETKFVAAKGKVGPINGTTIPRMELSGSLILARLMSCIKSAIKGNIELSEEDVLCTDSSTVLNWVNSEAIRYRPYVKNKIIEIQDLHPVKNWRYIPGKKNKAADLISKGCDVKDLENIINGPNILKLPLKEWPTLDRVSKKEDPIKDEENEEIVITLNSISVKEPVIELENYNGWMKLLRVTAYVMRFCKKKKNETTKDSLNNPTEEEMEEAQEYWIKFAQSSMKDLKEKELMRLTPFVDEKGIRRISGRLKNSPIFDNNRIHPKLLPGDHKISELIVRDIHEKTFHAGHLRVMAECRKKFWIIGLRKLTKSIGLKCVICRWWRKLPLDQFMSDLPSCRITPGYPFENSSVDYFGPIFIKFGRRAKSKGYGAIFTCMTTRSVHLELATDLTTDTFLMALRRFVSIYGQPKKMRSDNGKNFVGAAAELKKMLKNLQCNHPEKMKLQEFCAKNTIKWLFNTPRASHHNGSVESLIKSVKNALNKVVKNYILSEESYRTVLCEVTSSINSRPLWPATEGDVEQPPITCNDLLRPGGLERNPVTLDLCDNPRKRYQQIQRITNEWWSLWMKYFVPNLQIRNKWYKKRENLNVGDIVLIIDSSVHRASWSMAIVEEVYPGTDKMVRSVKVKSKDGNYVRPITKLTLLLSKDEYEEFKKE